MTHICKPYRFSFVLITVLSVVLSCVAVLPWIITGQLVDQAILGSSVQLLVRFLLLAAGVEVLTVLLDFWLGYVDNKVSNSLAADLQIRLFNHPEKELLNGLADGYVWLVTWNVPLLVRHLALILVSVATLFIMNWKLAVAGMILFPVMMLPVTGSERKNERLQAERNAILSEAGQAADVAEFKEKAGQMKAVSRRIFLVNRGYRILMNLLQKAGPFLICLAGGYLMSTGDASVTLGNLIVAIALVWKTQGPVANLISDGKELISRRKSCQPLFDALKDAEE